MARDKMGSKDSVVVHVKVLSDDLREIQETTRAVTRAVADARVHGKQISVVVTDEKVQMSIGDMKQLASYVTAEVMKALHIPSPT